MYKIRKKIGKKNTYELEKVLIYMVRILFCPTASTRKRVNVFSVATYFAFPRAEPDMCAVKYAQTIV